MQGPLGRGVPELLHGHLVRVGPFGREAGAVDDELLAFLVGDEHAKYVLVHDQVVAIHGVDVHAVVLVGLGRCPFLVVPDVVDDRTDHVCHPDVEVEVDHDRRGTGVGVDRDVAVDVLGAADGVDPVAVGGRVRVGRADPDLGHGLGPELDLERLAGQTFGQHACRVLDRDRLVLDQHVIEVGLDRDRDGLGLVARVIGQVGVGALAGPQHEGHEDEQGRDDAVHVFS